VADLANLRISVDSREVKKAATDLDQLNRSSTGVEQGVTKASSALRGFGAVLASLGIGLIAREAILMADTFTRMSGQLALVTNSAQQLAAAEKQLFTMSQNTRVGYETTVSLFSRLARSTENLGVSQQSVMRVTETINKAMIVSGTSAEQASGALMQLGQAFASGALRGDELNSVMEGMPRVAQAIAEGMGITVGELRKLGAQGKLTGAEVYAALLKMGDDIDSEFTRMPMTVSQSMTVLSNSLMLFIAEADRATGFTAALADGIVYLSNNLNQIARVAEVVIVAVAGMAAAFLALRAALAVQAIAAYIAQLIAAQFALGATTTAAAIAGAGIRGLQAILASTGWGLAVVAIGAVVGAIYMLVTAQSEARGETQNLINDLGRLAATQDKNFAAAAKRGYEGLLQVQSERNVLMERNKNIEAYTAKSGMVGKVAIEYKKNAAAIKEANEFLIKNGNAIIESKKVYNQVEPPLRNVSAAIEKTGKKAKEAIDPLEKYRDALADMVEEGKKIGMTPEQIKAFDVEKLALEAAAAGRKKYNKASQEGAGNNIANEIRQQGMLNALTQQAADIRQEVSEKLKDYAKSIVEANKAHNDTMTTLKGEATLLGLVGVEREKAALALEQEAYTLKFGADAWKEYHAARLSNIDAKSVIDKDIEALQTLTNNLETAAGMIGGKTGRSIQGILKTEITMKDGETKKISEAIASTFPQLGSALSAVLAGAQIGQSVDGLFKSIGIKSSKAGAQIGGAIGMAAFGPVGAIAGSILGGVIGGMLKKTKTGSATISQIAGQGMQTALSGNSAALRDVANTMANGLLKGLGNIAEQLGGTLGGNVKVSLGMRKKDFVVDPTGGGRTKGAGVKNFGTDEAAAVAYVTQLAIQQGIVTGISAGAQTLIRAGNDLNEQVQKALKFDQVFKDLVKESDPLRSSLDELSVEMEKLKVIFAEAGASAADYAKLEELYAIKQAKAIFEANRPRRELEIQLMEAQGDAAGALAAKRDLELESMDASLRGIQRLIFAQEDLKAGTEALAAAREAEQSAISDLRTAVDMLNSNVAEAEANLAEALRAQRERQMESYRAQIADLDTIIAKRDEAQAALRRAYDAEIARIDEEIGKRNANIQSLEYASSSQASILQGTIDQFRDFASTLREFASTIIPMNGTGPQSLEALRRRFADVTKAALGGDKTAMGEVVGVGGQLRESIMANATDRTSMLRQLYALQAQTNTVVSGAEDQATIAERQLAEAKLQSDHLISIENKAIAQLEAQKSATTALVGQFIQLTETNLSLDDAIRQLQTAEQAASSAEQQKAYLQGQINALAAVDASVMSVEQAQRELDEAKAERDSVLAEINARGFSELIRVTQQTGAEMARVAMSAIDAARSAAAQAQAALDAARAAAAAAAVRPPVVPPVVTTVTPPAVAVLPPAVSPFPVMDGGFGPAGGSRNPIMSEFIPQNFYGGGSGGGSFREFGFNDNVQLFANGGFHSGGLRIVGENGPEIEATGPSRIYNSNQLGNMLNHGATADEVKALRDEMKVAMYQIAKNTGKSYDIINRWNGDGLPPERNVG
jgi:tape measure domain-containing protein